MSDEKILYFATSAEDKDCYYDATDLLEKQCSGDDKFPTMTTF